MKDLGISGLAGNALLSHARLAIEYFLETKNTLPLDKFPYPQQVSAELERKGGLFVLLETTRSGKKSYIRGENGVFEAVEAIGKLLPQLAVNAAFYDPRTPRLKNFELNEVIIHIYLPFERENLGISWNPQLNGVQVETNGRMAYVLPELFQQGQTVTKEHLLRRLRLQLGVTKKKSETLALEYYQFSGQHFRESSFL